jgi:hypothetical protein
MKNKEVTALKVFHNTLGIKSLLAEILTRNEKDGGRI